MKKKFFEHSCENFKTFVNFEFAANCKMVLINDDQCQIAHLVIWSVTQSKKIESLYYTIPWVSYFTENQEFLVNSSFFLIKVKFLLFDRVWSIIKKNAEFWQIIEVKDDHIKCKQQFFAIKMRYPY